MKTRRFLAIFFLLPLVISLLALPAAAEDLGDVQAKAALLVDEKTGAVIYAKNEHQELYPASLTKIMTALLVFRAIDEGRLSMDQEVTASSVAESVPEGSSTADPPIKTGEVMTVRNLLYCLLVVSANEAGNVLAETVSGSIDAFVEEMNRCAEELGCEHTHFMNPHGFHDPQHYTSAWDLYLITKKAMEYPDFMTICDTTSTTIPATNLSPERTLYNTNYLICGYRSRGYLNGDAHGVKTGSHSQAGHCLVSTAQRASMSLVSVVLGTERVFMEAENMWWTYSFGETNRLFNWAFDNFTYETILSEEDVAGEAAVSLSRTDHVTLCPAQAVEIMVPKDLDLDELEREITLISDPVEAPIAEGDVLGTLTIRMDGKEYASVDLLALTDVEASRIRVLWRDVKEFAATTPAKVGAVVLGVLAALYLSWKLVFSKRRYRYGRSVGTTRSNGYRGRKR